MKKIGLLALILVLIAGLSPGITCMAAGGAWLELARAEDTPGSRDVLAGSKDVVALKFTLTAYFEDIQINSLRVNFFRYEDEVISSAQLGDVAKVRLDMEPDFQLTTSKDFDAGSNSVTFNGTDWLSPLVITQNTTKTFSVVFDIPTTCNASGLFATIGYIPGTGGKESDIEATTASGIRAPVSGSANGTFMMIKECGFISFGLPPDTPQSAILAVGETGVDNVTFTKIDFFAGRESIAIYSIPIVSTGNEKDLDAVSLYDEGAEVGTDKIGTDVILVNNEAVVNLPPDSPWIIPADTHKILIIKAGVNGTANGAVSGDMLRLGIKPNDVKAVGLISGKTIPPEQGAVERLYGNPMVLRKSKPYVAAASLPSTVLSAGEKVLYRWTVTADEKGDISWKTIVFEVSGSIQVGDKQFIIAADDFPVAEQGIYIIADGEGKKLIPVESLRVYNVATGTALEGAFHIWNLADKPLISFTASENQTVPVGETETYELRGDVLYDRGLIMTKIPDGSVIPDNPYIDNATFIWSDGVAWATDYLVPGIPTTTLALTKDGVTEEPSVIEALQAQIVALLAQLAELQNQIASIATKITIDAPTRTGIGSEFSAGLWIEVENLDACNYDVVFDPAVLKLTEVKPGQIAGKEFPVDISNEREPGRWTIVQNLPGLTGATGSGYLAVLRFKVISEVPGETEISLSNGVLSNTSAEAIPSVWGKWLLEITYTYLPGDVNGDGQVNALDITFLEMIIAGLK